MEFLSARPGRGATKRLNAGFLQCPGFYPHAPGGARPVTAHATTRNTPFLSARPGRGATRAEHTYLKAGLCFYPHAPGGARQGRTKGRLKVDPVSIRTPRAGRDAGTRVITIFNEVFLSARPGRGATRWSQWWRRWGGCFYPHAPGGARQAPKVASAIPIKFLSARPGRGATDSPHRVRQRQRVSIRTPRAGRDLLRALRFC